MFRLGSLSRCEEIHIRRKCGWKLPEAQSLTRSYAAGTTTTTPFMPSSHTGGQLLLLHRSGCVLRLPTTLLKSPLVRGWRTSCPSPYFHQTKMTSLSYFLRETRTELKDKSMDSTTTTTTTTYTHEAPGDTREYVCGGGLHTNIIFLHMRTV